VNSHPLKDRFAGLQQIRFALGCFWGAERKFWTEPGVYSTSVGYAGGITPNPTYEEVCSGLTGHTEVVQVVFDPAVVSLERLLQLFWESHDPTQGMRQGNDTGTQYRSAIHATDEAQYAAALASREAYQAQLDAAATARSPPRSCTRHRRTTTPRTITSSTWRRIRTATAASAAPA
jgi:peptide-methionine (S)-S-oxide reductase